MSSRSRSPLAILIAILITAGLLAACSGEDSGIRVEPATRANVTEVVEAPATVTARASVTITSPAGGRVAELRVGDGQAIRIGQTAAVIDSPAARQQLADAERTDAEAAQAGQVEVPTADLSAQQSQADRAAWTAFVAARRAARLVPDSVARQQALAAVLSAEAQYAAARAQARAAVRRFNDGIGSLAEALGSLSSAQRVQTRAAVTLARRTVESLVITAPISGVVALGATPSTSVSGSLGAIPESLSNQARDLLGQGGSTTGGASNSGPPAVGTPVKAGDQLMTITDVSRLSLTAEVDETDVLLVRPGVAADVELDAVPGATYPATVTVVAVSPTQSSRGGVAYVVRLALGAGTTSDGEPAPAPRPGMSAVADLKVRTAEAAVSVPAAAVFRDGARDAVWVVRSGAAQRRHVTLGPQGEDRIAISAGLDAGEDVVVSGADKVREGQRL